MTPVFVLTLSDIFGLVALGVFLLMILFVYIVDKIDRWKKQRKAKEKP